MMVGLQLNSLLDRPLREVVQFLRLPVPQAAGT